MTQKTLDTTCNSKILNYHYDDRQRRWEAMTDVTDDSQLCDVTDDQKPPGTRSYLTVGLPDPHPVRY